MEKTVFALSIGVVNIQSGKTQYDWSIYDGTEKYPAVETKELYHCTGSFLLMGAKGSLQEGDSIVIRHNDTHRKLKDAKVTKVLTCDKDTLVNELLELEYDYQVVRAFRKKQFSKKLGTSYSIKGVE